MHPQQANQSLAGRAAFGIDTIGVGQQQLVRPKFYLARETVYGSNGEETERETLCIALPVLGGNQITKRIATDHDKAMYPDSWAAFADGRPAPTHGTPLENLPGVTERIVQRAALLEIRTVEQMATEQAAISMGGDGREWMARAKAWLDQKAGAAALDLAAAVEALRQQNEQLARRVAATEAESKAKDHAIAVLKGAVGSRSQAADGPIYVGRQDEDVQLAGMDALIDGDGLVTDLDPA